MSKRIERILEALELERKQEEDYYRSLTQSHSFKDRIESGILWYPVSIDKVQYSIAEKIEIEVTPLKLSSASNRNSFRTGASAVFFINEEERTEIKGTISFANQKRIRIILNDDHLVKEQIQNKHNCGIELIYDDRPYRVMKQTLNEVIAATDPGIIALKNGIEKRDLEQHKISFPLKDYAPDSLLNDAQKEAVKGSVTAEHLSIIHGPPGTGKTTTLVSLVEALAINEKRILVVGPSNNVVDLLAKEIHKKGLSVVRVGNITRIGDNISYLALDEKVRTHKDWQHIKQVKIEAEQAKREADKYKRKFGPQQKRDRNAFRKEARELRKWARELEKRLVDSVLMDAQVICTTLIGCAHPILEGYNFETLIIDEGSQALEAESWTAMLKAKRTIIAGDHKQLPPTVKSNEAAKMGLSETILDRMTGQLEESFLLNIQYRMHDNILAFSNQEFYNNELVSATFVKNRSIPNDQNIVTFIDTSGCGFEEKRGKEGRSYWNEGECHIIREHILAQGPLYTPELSIGIISPYSGQVGKLKTYFGEDEYLRKLDTTINSIDGFQGQEKDVIYLSLVRSNDRGEIGFLKDYRRLNVAITRARYKLVIIGDMSTLANDPLYNRLADHIEANATYQSAWEYMYDAQ